MPLKTSVSSPLQINTIVTNSGGCIGITLCPGKKDAARLWDRDLDADISVINEWGASILVSLMEDHEFDLLGVRQLPYIVEQKNIDWFHLPIRDVSIPDHRFYDRWSGLGVRMLECIGAGGKVLIHCRGGLGRSGVVAALLLIETGIDGKEAVDLVRQARRGAIETIQQEAYVRGYRKMLQHK